MNGLAVVVCPVCAMAHERTTTRSIFCPCGSAAAYRAGYGWSWFRRAGRGVTPPTRPEPETETEARGCAGPEIDL